MIRLTYLFILLVTTPALATDYIVRVETTGYVDAEIKPDSVEPEERTLRTMETLCRVGQPFRARMTVGNETTTLKGVLRKSDDPESDFSVEVTYSHIVALSPTAKPVTACNTRLDVVKGKPLKVGGSLTSITNMNAEDQTQKRTSKISFTVTVEEYDPKSHER